jgi:hypothetical protein
MIEPHHGQMANEMSQSLSCEPKGRAIFQAVSLRLATAAAQVRS